MSESTTTTNQESSPVALNWLLKTARSEPGVGGVILEVFEHGCHVFHYTSDYLVADNRGIVTPFTLMETKGFRLMLDDGKTENSISAQTSCGAGEVVPANGHIPVLMLLYLKQRISESGLDATLDLCDEQGNSVEYERFDSILSIIDRHGFDLGEVRRDAERLALVSKPIDLSEIQSDIEDCYF